MAKYYALLFGLLYSVGAVAQTAPLASDELGTQSDDAVAVATVDDDFLLPTYALPADPVSVQAQLAVVNPVPNEVDILTEIFGSDAATLQPVNTTPAAQSTSTRTTFSPTPSGAVHAHKNQSVLEPLPPLPEVVPIEPLVPVKEPTITHSAYADQVLTKLQDKNAPASNATMPREVRISFYKNQFALNGQAMKWIKIFALKVLKDPRLIAEIRVSDQNWSIQRRRLSLLLQTLMEQGVSRHQLRVYKSGRETDTIILTATKNMAFGDETISKNTVGGQKTITW